ncbi:MAG: Nramp family divalent metal transporter [Opitutaceae bacterium]|nr:Nramp family divalent metal transporter [Cytophagales bacterium]
MNKIQEAPKGKETLKWLGPAFIWMLSAAGSGELLFTPRIGGQYGYMLLWAMLIAVGFKWFINKEIGRYTVCAGASVYQGFSQIGGSSNWIVWFIIAPQVLASVTMIAGLTGAAVTALVLILNWQLWLLSGIILAVSSIIIVVGKYKLLEKVLIPFAIINFTAIIIAALSIKPDLSQIAKGFAFKMPDNVKYDELLPWLGFMLAGASGLTWFSFWIQAKGYGSSGKKPANPINVFELKEPEKEVLKGWIRHMSLVNNIAVLGVLFVALAYMILGTELLLPKGLVPEENKIAETLGQMLGEIWGKAGFWFMIGIIFITFLSTILSNLDGYGRMFVDGIVIISPKKSSGITANPELLKKIIVIFFLTVIPFLIYVIGGQPISLLKLAGAIEAIHIPFVAVFILYLNLKKLPDGLRPGIISIIGTCLAGLFFGAFAVAYILQISGTLS